MHTEKELYNALIKFFDTNTLTEGITPEEMRDFCALKLDILNRKTKRLKDKAAAKKAAPDPLRDAILEALTEDSYMSREDIAQVLGPDDISVNQIGYRMNQLVAEGLVTTMKVPGKGKRNRSFMKVVYARVPIED